jgi:hypothetical protein
MTNLFANRLDVTDIGRLSIPETVEAGYQLLLSALNSVATPYRKIQTKQTRRSAREWDEKVLSGPLPGAAAPPRFKTLTASSKLWASWS